MGCFNISDASTSSFKIVKIKTINYKIISILDIPADIVDLNLSGRLTKISDFYSFCNMTFLYLENLNLSNNNLLDISELKKLKAPKLKILDLSYNNINNLDIFKELDFPLEELYLKGNQINEIEIFEKADILKNLKKLRFSIKDYESNKRILQLIKESINDFEYDTINNDIINYQMINKLGTLPLNS